MSAAVHFTRVDVRQMPGFPRGGLAVGDLVPGINVIYGPNASGKTTLARAMQRLLQTPDDERSTNSLSAEIVVAGRPYELDFHHGKLLCHSGGHAEASPVSLPADVSRRHILALHELIQEGDDRDIVQHVLREAAGGYDIRAAAEKLQFDQDRPGSRPFKIIREVEAAVRARKEAEARLLDVDRDEQLLGELERQRNSAHQAQQRVKLLESALEALDRRDARDRARGAMAEFPAELSRLTGDEWKRLGELKNRLHEQQNALAAAAHAFELAQDDVQESQLPAEGVPAEWVATLQKRCESLRERTREIKRREAELKGATEALHSALSRLGPNVSLERAASLNDATLARLFKFIRQAEDCHFDGKAAEAVAQWLNGPAAEDADPETLRDGIMLLQQWLAEQRIAPAPARGTGPWIIAAVLTAVAAAAMALVHISWLLLLLPALGLAAWPFLEGKSAAAPAMAQGIPEQWTALGFSAPAAWSVAEVQAELRRLQQRWAAARLTQEKRQRFHEIQERRNNYKEQRLKIDSASAQWRQSLGIDVNVDDARLYLVVEAVHRVQVAQERVSELEASLAAVQEESDLLLQSLNEALAPYFRRSPLDVDEASALVQELERRRQAHRDASRRRERAEIDRHKCLRQIEKLEAEQVRLLADVGLMPHDETTLRIWTDQYPQYRQAREELRLAERDAETAAAALDGHEELLERSREQLHAELDQCRRSAEQLKELDERLGDIRGRIRRAKDEKELEAALSDEESRLDELRKARDGDVYLRVGNVWFAYLLRHQRDDQQPGILTRAAELFSRVTHGRYRLLVESGDPPGFRALDTSLGREQGLEELSSGTRLQLLLSVRVAFVEQREQGLKLPIIFDETLGNSDEQRAARILEAAIELAREGRQIFYLTAQYDELGKWRRALQAHPDLAHRELDLARIRGFSEVEFAPEQLDYDPPPRPPIPAPTNESWEAYGRLLNVPPLDRRGNVGGVHLWYLLDDVQALHRLLSNDINKWGQLQSLVDIRAIDGLTRESPLYRRASASARLLEMLFRSWRRGRGEPVDRSILEASGAVSASFIDEVSQLCQSLDGDARQLIAKLRAGVVRRFRNAQIESLAAYLTERGCLDDQPVLDQEAVRSIITPLVFADCDQGLLSRERVDRLVSLVMGDSQAVEREARPIESNGSP